MGQQGYSRRDFISYAIVAGGGTVLLGACTPGGRSSRTGRTNGTSGGGVSELPPIEGAVVITDPAQIPTKFSESPEFAKLVEAGKLPPAAERIGQDPLVIKPLHSVGTYGGELRRGYIGAMDHQNGRRFATGPDTLLYWDYEYKKVVPNIALGYELSKDGKALTLHLRRGMKWSDGHPFTADDIVFWREDINLNKDLGGAGSTSLRTAGGLVQVRKVDDYTVQFISPVPHPVLPKMLASRTQLQGLAGNLPTVEAGYAPKHYLTQFLPKHTSMAEANRKAAAAGFKGWSLYVRQLMDWATNTALPVLTPWVVTRPITKSPWMLEANPYSIWVDTKGNQLPYIPKITMRDAGNAEVLKTQAVSGAYDFEDRGLDLPSLQVLLRNQQRSNYTVHRTPSDGVNVKMRVNLAYVADKVIGDLLRNVDFRRALSLGIDRDEINKTFFLGTGVPTASMVADDSPYFPGAEWRTKWATHDVAQANQLLDKIGLTAKDRDGFRLRPDNKGRIRLDFSANKFFADIPAMSEMIRTHWRSIGIDASVTDTTVNSTDLVFANKVQLMPLQGIPSDVFISRVEVLPTNNVAGVIGLPYAQWFDSGGKQGVRPPESLRLEEAMDLYQRGLQEVDDAKRIEIGKQIYMLHADQVWSIGLVGSSSLLNGMYLAKNNLGNVPRRVLNEEDVNTPSNVRPMTLYFK